MQTISLMLFQLDECCRHILDGRLAQLRLALVLLDNAAEVQMDKRIRHELAREEYNERVREGVLEMEARGSDIPDHLRRLLGWEPLSNKAKRAIDRFFDEKVDALTTRWPCLDPQLAKPLKYLHKYRNEAYHRAEIRQGTIATAARILLDINCTMFLAVYPPGHILSWSDDYSWIEQRFGVSGRAASTDREFLNRAIDDIRSSVSLTDEAVSHTLSDHMESRIEDLLSALDFMVAGTYLTDRSMALRCAQYDDAVRKGTIDSSSVNQKAYDAPYAMDDIEAFVQQVPEITRAGGRLEAFGRFSDLESAIEPLEAMVMEAAAEVDQYIQMEIDRIRGK